MELMSALLPLTRGLVMPPALLNLRQVKEVLYLRCHVFDVGP